MAARLFGVETEYAVAGWKARGQPLDRGVLIEAMLGRASKSLPHLRDGSAHGMFLANGARFYVDCGSHPEFTTPECSTPHEVVRYILAGERILLDLAKDAVPRPRGARLAVYRGNVDYSESRATWGCHESYMHRVDPRQLPAQIIPHLVSRLVYSGAGGFNNLSAGIEFTLSPRVPHMTADVSGASTHSRGIFHTKDEPLCTGGAHRLHLLCGESLYSETATVLKIGTTALIVALIEAGFEPGAAVALGAPLEAMNAFAADPSCTVTVLGVGGRSLRAIDIQRHYLAMVEEHLGHAVMPPWAESCCALWRSVLDRLEQGPHAVAAEIDWAIKLPIYREHVRRRGLAWESLSVWNRVATQLAVAQQQNGRPRQELSADVLAAGDGPVRDEVARLTPLLAQHGMTWNLLPCFLAVRRELHEIDVRCGQLGEDGIFAQLDAKGVLRHRVTPVDEVARAMGHPPEVGRARVRGTYVGQLGKEAQDDLVCDWSGIWDRRNKRAVDLRDPFARDADWGEWFPAAPSLHVDAAERLARRTTERERLAESVEDAERRWGPDHVETALACNQLSVSLRSLGRPGEAEPFSRRALSIDEAARGADHPKIPHRLNNLALVLAMQGQLPEARQLLARAWALNAERHDLTSARIVWTRLFAATMDGEAQPVLLGLMKTLLALPLEAAGDISSHWQIAPVIDYVRPRISPPDADLLLHLGETLNDRQRMRGLDAFLNWIDAPPIALDTPWPAEGTA